MTSKYTRKGIARPWDNLKSSEIHDCLQCAFLTSATLDATLVASTAATILGPLVGDMFLCLGLSYKNHVYTHILTTCPPMMLFSCCVIQLQLKTFSTSLGLCPALFPQCSSLTTMGSGPFQSPSIILVMSLMALHGLRHPSQLNSVELVLGVLYNSHPWLSLHLRFHLVILFAMCFHLISRPFLHTALYLVEVRSEWSQNNDEPSPLAPKVWDVITGRLPEATADAQSKARILAT